MEDMVHFLLQMQLLQLHRRDEDLLKIITIITLIVMEILFHEEVLNFQIREVRISKVETQKEDCLLSSRQDKIKIHRMMRTTEINISIKSIILKKMKFDIYFNFLFCYYSFFIIIIYLYLSEIVSNKKKLKETFCFPESKSVF